MLQIDHCQCKIIFSINMHNTNVCFLLVNIFNVDYHLVEHEPAFLVSVRQGHVRGPV